MELEERFENFMLSLPSVEGIDLIELKESERQQKKADYLAMGRQIVIEQKCINQEQASKIQKEVEKFSGSDEYPIFYGKRDLNSVIDKLPNKEEIKRTIYSKSTRLLESYLVQANKQIESTVSIFGLNAICGVLVILNGKVKVLSPEVVASRIQQRLNETRNGTLRFPKIDYVIFISETHNLEGIPIIVVIKGANASTHSSATSEYIDYLVHSWGHFNGGNCAKFADSKTCFEKIKENEDPAPDKLTRSEARILWYKKNRYMEGWTDLQVAMGAAKLIDDIQPFVMKGGPALPRNKLTELMMQFSDFIEESNLRGLDIREFKKYHQT